ncbi:restriction endonuclease subunit S [Stutzerimonas kunmingensis]|uniref:restriction endonuclease subunit S n=1 Tax=Stutzerimonas kunmingensis TaxID=1211807 RepID=UPI001F2C50BD|nr:restriction endonuclease subunit S [Stutzerimonas kunmingensis]UIP31925.1 restriction endonuclease subunit S [Stutzerimonas kunmingensis]
MTNLSGANLNNGAAVSPQGEGMDSPSTFPKYPAYKDSRVPWIGEVPVTWEVKPFKWLLDNNDGGVWGDDPTGEGDTLVLRSTDQTVDGNWKLTDPAPRKLSAKEKTSALLIEGDLVVTKSSGSSLHIGKTTLVTADIAKQGCCFGNFMQRLRVNSSFTPKLAWYVMNNELARAQLDLLSNSTTGLANLNGTLIGEILLPVSTVAEQAQITRFLDHETARIDALIEEQQRLIDLLNEKRQAVISHAVTKGLDPTVPMKDSGVEWLGEVPAHWDVCQVRHLMVGDTRNGLYKPEGEKDPDGVGFVQMGEAFRDRIFQGGVKDRVQASNTELKNWGLEEGDLLFARRSIVLEGSGRCTRVGSLNEPHLFESSMIRIRLDLNRVSPEYLHLMFDSIGMRAQVLSTTKTVTISGIDSGQLKGLRLAVPAKSEQENIAAYLLSRIEAFDDAERAAMETTLLLQERRSALISAAVTGKIDVRDWQPTASTQAPELAVAEAV